MSTKYRYRTKLNWNFDIEEFWNRCIPRGKCFKPISFVLPDFLKTHFLLKYPIKKNQTPTYFVYKRLDCHVVNFLCICHYYKDYGTHLLDFYRAQKMYQEWTYRIFHCQSKAVVWKIAKIRNCLKMTLIWPCSMM